MCTIKVLCLDDAETYVRQLEELGVRAVVTQLETSEVYSPAGGGRYKVSRRGCELAHDATTDRYDFIVIGNNLGSGYDYARVLPPELRSRTLIVWNDFRPEYCGGAYAILGFEHFCSRLELADYLLTMLNGESTDPTDDHPLSAEA